MIEFLKAECSTDSRGGNSFFPLIIFDLSSSISATVAVRITELTVNRCFDNGLRTPGSRGRD